MWRNGSTIIEKYETYQEITGVHMKKGVPNKDIQDDLERMHVERFTREEERKIQKECDGNSEKLLENAEEEVGIERCRKWSNPEEFSPKEKNVEQLRVVVVQ